VKPFSGVFLFFGIFLLLLGSAMLAQVTAARGYTYDAVQLTDDVIYEIINGINSNLIGLPEDIFDALDQGLDTARDATIQVVNTGTNSIESAANDVIRLINQIGRSFNNIQLNPVDIDYEINRINLAVPGIGEWDSDVILPGTYVQSVNFSSFFIPNPPFLLEELLEEPIETTYYVFETTFIVVLSLGIASIIASLCILVGQGFKPFIPAWVGAIAEFIRSIKRKSFWIPLLLGVAILFFTMIIYGINREAESRIQEGIRIADEEIEGLITYVNNLNIAIPDEVENTINEGTMLLNNFVNGQINIVSNQVEDQIDTISTFIEDVFNAAADQVGADRIGIPASIGFLFNINIPNPNIELPPVTFPEIPSNLIRLRSTVQPVMQEGIDAVFFLIGILFSVAALLICVPCFTVVVRVCYAYWDAKK